MSLSDVMYCIDIKHRQNAYSACTPLTVGIVNAASAVFLQSEPSVQSKCAGTESGV